MSDLPPEPAEDPQGPTPSASDNSPSDDPASDPGTSSADPASSASDSSPDANTPPPDADMSSSDGGASSSGSDSASTDGGASSSSSDSASGGDGGSSDASGGAADAAAPTDPGQPYLFVDLYSGDDGRLVGRQPDWKTLAGTKNYCGAILKAWDGIHFNDGGWFKRHWPAVRDAGGANYGQSWFRGAYLFLEFQQSGADQADAYLAAVDAAGGWGGGDILPIIDVEQGGAGHRNRSASKQQVIDCVTACAARVREQTGRRVILYGRGAMRDLGIADKMGCDLVWNPAYTAAMVVHGLEAFALEDIVLWQYCGDGQAAIKTLPNSVAGFGPCDLSVFVKGAQTPTLQMVRDNLLS